MTNTNPETERKNARYRILEQGPDNNSTYAECWGGNPASDGSFVADCDTFDEVREVIHELGHQNYTIRDRRQHRTFVGPALKKMAAEIATAEVR